MKNFVKFQTSVAVATLLAIVLFGTACKKDNTVTPTTTDAISTVNLDATTLGDVQTLSCQLPDTTDLATLASGITTYMSSNYAAYTIQFASVIQNAGTVTGYLLNTVNGDNRMVVRFDASGNFVKALTMPLHAELAAFNTDTVAISSLPAALQTYLSSNTNYAVQKAFQESDNSYTVIATSNGAAYSLSYTTDNPTVLNVINLGADDLSSVSTDLTRLPSTVMGYINGNFAGATVEAVLVGSCSGANNGSTVIFKNNGTQYAAEFDATGAFMEVISEK